MLYRPVLTTSTADRSRSSNHITARCLKPTQFFWLTTNIVGAPYSLVMMYLPVIRLFSKVRDVSRNKHMPVYGSSNGLEGGQLLQVSRIPFSGLSDKLTNPVNSLMTCVVFSSPLLVQFSCSVVSDSLRPHESQHARPPCPSPTPRVHSDSRPLSR